MKLGSGTSISSDIDLRVADDPFIHICMSRSCRAARERARPVPIVIWTRSSFLTVSDLKRWTSGTPSRE
jgi:hypothetical protein